VRVTGSKACYSGFRNKRTHMTSKPKTLDVAIMGRSYKVACEEHEREGLLAAVAYLDGKMGDIKAAGKVASAERIAVMAALNIAHELLVVRNGKAAESGFDTDALKRRMNSMQALLDEVLVPQERLI
jgi:cell division protein ZapA